MKENIASSKNIDAFIKKYSAISIKFVLKPTISETWLARPRFPLFLIQFLLETYYYQDLAGKGSIFITF